MRRPICADRPWIILAAVNQIWGAIGVQIHVRQLDDETLRGFADLAPTRSIVYSACGADLTLAERLVVRCRLPEGETGKQSRTKQTSGKPTPYG